LTVLLLLAALACTALALSDRKLPLHKPIINKTGFVPNRKLTYGSPAEGSFTLHPIEHASFYLVVSITGPNPSNFIVFSDPYDTGNGYYDNLPDADVIVITHPHSDHFDLGAIAKVAVAGQTIFVGTKDVSDGLIAAGYPASTIHVLANFQTANIYSGIFSVDSIPAYNFPPTTFHPEGSWNGYILNLRLAGSAGNETHVYIAGDTEDIPEMRSLRNIDVAFVCMNLPYTMDVDHAADAVIEFKPKRVYPYHYRSEDINRFRDLVEEGTDEVEVVLLNWYPAGFDKEFFDKLGF